MKKVLSALLVLVMSLSLAACGGGKNSANEIPDVFGVNYTDAIGILEGDGFEVSAVEASVGSFSDKLLYPLEKVDKGTVFKIDEYIIDNNGNLNKNYDVFYDEGLVSTDKSVVIYYAKEDYVLEKDEAPVDTTPSTQPSTESSTEATTPHTAEDEKNDTGDNSIDPAFKAAMDSYEEFFDEYVAIMKKYKENPTDMSILADYTKYMGQYADTMQKMEDWENEDLNTVELAYYLEVQNRITQKLLEIA